MLEEDRCSLDAASLDAAWMQPAQAAAREVSINAAQPASVKKAGGLLTRQKLLRKHAV